MKSYPSEWVGSHEIRFPLPRGRAATNPITKYHVHVRHGPRTLARYAYYPGNEVGAPGRTRKGPGLHR